MCQEIVHLSSQENLVENHNNQSSGVVTAQYSHILPDISQTSSPNLKKVVLNSTFRTE